MSKVKQVIVIRMDLVKRVRLGYLAVQVAHASMKVFLDRGVVVSRSNQGRPEKRLEIGLSPEMVSWVDGLFVNVLSVDTEAEMLEAYELAKEAGLPSALITDAGLTIFKKPCLSCGGTGYFMAIVETGYDQCPHCKGTGKVGVPTNTCIAIGPARSEDINKITGQAGAVKTRLL